MAAVRVRLLLCIAAALVTGIPVARAATQAGEVVIARGIATAQGTGASGRILGAGSPVFEGDVVSTGPRSVALLKLADGTRMTLRPQTKFKVEEYRVSGADAGAVYRLFQGGLRAVTGYLSKRNPNAVRLRTAVATIGIRGTEFDARLCGADCAAEAATRATPAGRAGFVRGDVQARAGNGDRVRAVTTGGPIYSGDTLVTAAGGMAVLLFKDKSRVTLLPETEFRVEHLVFDETKPEEGRGFFALVRGGLRAVSGAIGKYGRRDYQMRTPVATIGIRGSEYNAALQGLQLFTQVVDCCIAADDGPNLTPEQGVLMFGGPGLAPVPVPEFPIPVEIPPEANLPPPPEPAAPATGALQDSLVVACYVGNCDVQAGGETTELGAGQAARVGADGGAAETLPEIPAFMPEDPTLRTVEDNSSLNFLDQTLEGGGSECFVQ